MRTVEPANHGLLRLALLDNELDVRVIAGQVLDVIENIPAEVRGGWPDIAVFKDEFPQLRNERDVAICGPRGNRNQLRDSRYARHACTAAERE